MSGMVVIIYNWKEQVGFTLMVENPPFSTQTIISQMKTGFLIFSEIDRKSSKIKALNDFD